LIDPEMSCLDVIKPDALVDATLAKRDTGIRKGMAPITIALGPGFVAGVHADVVIETNRGHDLGRIITEGSAEANTGVPGSIGGFSGKRVLRSPTDGKFTARRSIGDHVAADEIIATVAEEAVRANISGVIRGLMRSDTAVTRGLKIGDIDPRGLKHNCYTISEKARAIGGSVLEAVLRVYN
jgi:xanthine dehydrogenase accessory factor